MANTDIPRHLKHKPIIGVDYKLTDERAGAGDALFLSIGKAQWNENGEDISAKIFRWANDRYSRQSEELPLWRVLDLAKLVIATITGQKSSLNESSVSDEDMGFLQDFLSENSELYTSRMNELRKLLNYKESDKAEAEDNPNIFSYATSELSQDAILAWLLSWADDKYAKSDSALCALGKSFVSLLTGMKTEEIHTVSVGRQWQNIDIWVEINEDAFLTIEDKTGTSIHDDQLIRYKSAVEDYYNGSRDKLFFAYIKTRNEPKSVLKVIEAQGFKTFSRKDILNILNSYSEDNILVKDFRRHLQGLEDASSQFKISTPDKWDASAWEGFFSELENHIEIDSWGYVPNRAGGFMGMWWHWVENDEVLTYLQFEEKKLCVKIEYSGDGNNSDIRNKYHEKLMSEADKSGLPVNRPARFGAGTYMTIGVVDEDFIFGKKPLDIPKIVKRLKEIEKLIDRVAETNK